MILLKESKVINSLIHHKPNMANNPKTLFFLLIMVISSVSATNTTSKTIDILQAIDEMRKANYFTFVMLINMAPPDFFQGNITFLMPKDKTLSQTLISQNDVADFLLQHSIPSPLLLEHLEHFPTGSIIPTSKPDIVLKVNNSGRQHFFLNNARIVSPNICTGNGSIICHGIDQVLESTTFSSDHHNSTFLPVPSHCPNVTTPPFVVAAPPPVMSLPPSAEPVRSGSFNNPTPSWTPLMKSGAQSILQLRDAVVAGLLLLLLV
ncbi:uncharacterized protein LOC107805551 [Nicotiana tabacum]|uniref:Uncharacterized protein LOC107805551 n=2 Tax=Nicotiana TaxID=4085 RepID=A0A1S4B8A0_TOBAC|nr:uncharacterized protein LOC104102663 [Nicotiana tomentosiformis]XP_016485099.1 PREDICTED: uncharacterized protein LOC107805551 [Nicotiana tabacum]